MVERRTDDDMEISVIGSEDCEESEMDDESVFSKDVKMVDEESKTVKLGSKTEERAVDEAEDCNSDEATDLDEANVAVVSSCVEERSIVDDMVENDSKFEYSGYEEASSVEKEEESSEP